MKSRKERLRRAREADRKREKARTQRDSTGRVHLALHRDPASGAEHVSLDVPVFRDAWQNEFTAAAANTARGILRTEPSVARTVELARNAMAATSRLAEGLLARAPAGAVACHAGCDHCCYQVVGVTPPEALAILDHLRNTLTSAQLEELTAHVAALHARAAELSASERFSPEHPCAFLKDGRCSIYEVRPLSCRGMNSLDAGECAKRLRDPEARAEFLAEGLGGHSYIEPIRAFHAVSAGLQLGLSELYQLDMRPLELTAALHLLLTGAAALPGEWVSGGRPFEAVRATDRTNDASMRELSGTLLLDPAAPPPQR